MNTPDVPGGRYIRERLALLVALLLGLGFLYVSSLEHIDKFFEKLTEAIGVALVLVVVRDVWVKALLALAVALAEKATGRRMRVESMTTEQITAARKVAQDSLTTPAHLIIDARYLVAASETVWGAQHKPATRSRDWATTSPKSLILAAGKRCLNRWLLDGH
jgi:hypothetical protein